MALCFCTSTTDDDLLPEGSLSSTRIRQTYPTLAVVISLILLSFSGQFQSWRDGDERFGCGVPWKAIGMAFLLFGLGTFLLVLGLLIHTGHVENDKEEDR